MDFFSSKPQSQDTNPLENNQTPFAHAIGLRFSGAATSALLTPALNPPVQPLATSIPQLSLPHRALATPGLSGLSIPSTLSTSGISGSAPRRTQLVPAQDASSYTQLTPSQVPDLLSQKNIVIVDTRPHGQFLQTRLPDAVSLNIPATLLRRPNHDLSKITATITEPRALERFNRWKSADTLLLLDSDTTVLADTNSLLGLLRKFRTAGYSGNLCWVKGGMAAIYKEARSIVEEGAMDSAEDTTHPAAGAFGGDGCRAPGGFLRPRDLPVQAFTQTSTTMLGQSKPPHDTPTFTAANPFYDNIRQNQELAQGVGDRIPLLVPDAVRTRREELPFQWLRDLVVQAETADRGAESLALQFYRIEVGEQRRLQGIMSHHSRQSDDAHPVDRPPTAPTHFPFSITAGIEMGNKNRYRNIWPFEHARVRLRTVSAVDGSDYVNASYVQPMITKRRYIATQGPLATTFNDFWMIVWEQNVPVIVMLTREVEGNHVKCGCYWKDGRYGDIELKLEEQVGTSDVASIALGQGGFNFGTTATDAATDEIIKRTFTVRNHSQPDAPARKVVHLQYLGWPDLNVPESSRGVLKLIKHVNAALVSASPNEEAEPGPIMLHCSAGVGRTGGFIIVDSILDGIRREMRKENNAGSSGFHSANDSGGSSDAMELDEPEQPEHEPDSPPDISNRVSRSLQELPLFANSTTSFPSSRSDAPVGHSLPPGSIRFPSKVPPSTNGNKQRRLSHALAEKLVKASVAANPPLSNTATINAWSANLPSSSSDYASNGNGKGKGTESKGNSPSPPDFRGDESDIYFKVPRKLHQPDSPPLLSTLREPIREVLEDMREQRMSLCQSLRQYVFVNRVILEGALEIVDEGRENQLKRQQLEQERESEHKRPVQPWDVLQQHQQQHQSRDSISFLQMRSQPPDFWSSTSSFSSMPDDTGSSAAPSSTAQQSTSNMTSPPNSVVKREASPPRTAAPPLPVPISPMRGLTISLSSSPSSRPMAGRLSHDSPRTPGSVAIGLPPPVLTGKRSHSPSKWQRNVDQKRSVEGHEDDEMATIGGPTSGAVNNQQPSLAKRPSIKRKQRSDDSIEGGLRSGAFNAKLGPGVGMTALGQ